MTMARETERRKGSILLDKVYLAPNVFGRTYYVDATLGADANKGWYPEVAKKTIASAITDASAGDTVVLKPGTHSIDVSAAALVPKADMTFVAAVPARGGAPNVIIVADADDGASLVDIDVDGVTWEGIEFRLIAGGSAALVLINLSQTTAVRGGLFTDCWFNLNSVDAASVYAVAANDASNATTGVTFDGCTFVGGDATTNVTNYIQVGVGGIPNCVVSHCVFVLESADGDAVGFDFLDPGAPAKSYGVIIKDNDFIGPSDGGGDAVGIKIAAATTEDEIVAMIRGNFFSNCTAAVTIDKVNNSLVNNYEGDNSTGGTLVNPGT